MNILEIIFLSNVADFNFFSLCGNFFAQNIEIEKEYAIMNGAQKINLIEKFIDMEYEKNWRWQFSMGAGLPDITLVG